MRKNAGDLPRSLLGKLIALPQFPYLHWGGRFAEEKGGERDGRKGMRRVKGGRRGTGREGDDAGR